MISFAPAVQSCWCSISLRRPTHMHDIALPSLAVVHVWRCRHRAPPLTSSMCRVRAIIRLSWCDSYVLCITSSCFAPTAWALSRSSAYVLCTLVAVGAVWLIHVPCPRVGVGGGDLVLVSIPWSSDPAWTHGRPCRAPSARCYAALVIDASELFH